MTKKYVLLKNMAWDLNLVLSNGRKITVLFKGGFLAPKMTPGYYRTDDPLIQEALEAHNCFNDKYALAETIHDKEFVFNPEIVTGSGLTPPGNTPTTDEVVYEVTNAKEAKQWLIDKKGALPAELKNVPAIDAYCIKNKIVFVDWLTIRERK